MWKAAAFVAFAIIALAAVYLAPQTKTAPEPCTERCNVILIVVDTLGAKHLKAYGYSRDTMPQTEAFFKKNGGILFENAESAAPWTLPSFASLYFSDLASRVSYKDLRGNGRPNLINLLRNNRVRIEGVLTSKPTFINDAVQAPFTDSEKNGFWDREHVASTSIKTLGSLLQESTSSPFFMIVHSVSAHDPYTPKEPFNKEFGEVSAYPRVSMDDILQANQDIHKKIPGSSDLEKRDIFELRYDQGIAQTDADLAAFLNSISREVLDDTVIILTADHGEAFLEHGLYWHTNSFYEEELHVPLIMHVPGYGSVRIAEPVSLLDLSPTILTFMHTPVPTSFIGKDLSPLMQGRSLGKRSLLFINGMPFYLNHDSIKPGLMPQGSLKEAGAEGSDQPIIAPEAWGMRENSLKLFVDKNELHVYDLAKDPDEKNDLAKNGLQMLLTHALQDLNSSRGLNQ